MRILVVGNFGHGWDGSICDEENIAVALESLDHEVIRQQREENTMPFYGDVDFTLMAQWDGYDLALLDKLPKPLVYWAFDYQRDGQEWHEKLVGLCDVYLTKRVAELSRYPDKAYWLPADFAPDFMDARRRPFQDIDVLFTGSFVPWESARERIEILKFIDEWFNLTIHSVTAQQWIDAGFKNVQGPVMDNGLMELIPRAKINISIDNVHEAGFWSDRNAQIMACNGFVLFRHVPLSETVFRDNIAYFYDRDTCYREIDYYLNHPRQREAIADAGYKYAQSNLSAIHRVSDMLKVVEYARRKVNEDSTV